MLPPAVAEKVAAGEVIQRPADVVKELVENAVDAIRERAAGDPTAASRGAVQVELKGGGLELIRVVDDGCGIAAEELELAVARHGTSKLRDVEGLGSVTTLGFRGEALPSIAAVAELTVLSRTPDAAAGAHVVVEGGVRREAGPQGCPVGTQVVVRRLFFNLPARLAFQRTPAGENAHIAHLVGIYALACPELQFQLVVNGRRVLQSGGGPRDVLAAVYGPEAAEAALPVELIDPAGLRVHGLICGPELTRGSRSDILLLVNGRPIVNRALIHSVVDACRGFVPDGRYPLAVLSVELAPDEVDVNVHPSKAEVRFRRDRLVYATLQRAVRAALLAAAPVPTVSAARPFLQNEIAAPLPAFPRREHTSSPPPEPAEPEPAPTAGGGRLPILRIVGQVQGTYIVCEGPDGVYFVDQHAAHERVLYEQVVAQRAAGGVVSQQLLEPRVVDLRVAEVALLAQHAGDLARLGFGAEPFGDAAALLRAVPASVVRADPGAALRALLESLADPTPTVDGLDRAAATLACHAAVRAGDALSPDLMRELIQRLEQTDVGRFCPHGRPTVIRLPAAQLERDFGRR